MDFVVQHFQTLLTVLFELDDLDCALPAIFATVPLVNFAAVARADFLADIVGVVADGALG